MKLMETIDSYIPEPKRAIDKPFLMPVEDVSPSPPRHLVTGRVERDREGRRRKSRCRLHPDKKTVATGVEMFRKLLDEGRAGDNCASTQEIEKKTSSAGKFSPSPQHHSPHQVHGAGLRALEGKAGAHAVLQRYRPQFYFRTTDGTAPSSSDRGRDVMPATT